MATAGPEGPGGWHANRAGRATAAVVAAVLGFGGAAAVDTALADPPLVEAGDPAPAGDGRTRLVVDDPAGIDAATLTALDGLAGVDSAQLLFDGTALLAGYGITPDAVRALLPDAAVTVSVPGEALGQAVTDPYWAAFGYHLSNTGANAYNQAAVAGADVAAPAGWQAGTGRGTVIAVVDSGVMTSHPDLAGALWTDPGEPCGTADTDGDGYAGDCHGWNFYANSPDVTNGGGDNSHGTGVAGAAVARAGNGEGLAGVAPDATVMPLVIGSGRSVDLYLGAQAIRYAADHGADVVNASWGGPGGAQILRDAIAYANSKGVVVVAAAGNDALDRDTSPFYPASINAPNVLTVGASTAADTVASFSAYGAGTVDVFAPGNLVVAPSNTGGYGAVSGTSIAAPQVAAAVALYRAHDRAASAGDLAERLLRDARPVAAFAGRSVTGGRLSLAALGATGAPVSYTFTGMHADPGTVAPTVVTGGSAPAGAYSVRLGLGMEHDGEVYALTRQPVTVGGVTAATDDEGQVEFDLGSRPGPAATVTPRTDLAEGRYVLTAQLVRDGVDVGLSSAAPLLVGVEYQAPGAVSPAPSSPAPGTPVPGTSTPGTSTPGTSTPGTPTPGASTPGTASPAPGTGSPAPGATSPRTPAPGTPTPGTPAPGTPAPGTPAPGTSAPGTPAPRTPTPGTPAPGTSTLGAPAPGTPTPGPSAPGSGTPAPTAPVPGAPAPDLGGRTDYPRVGPFRLTSVSPTRVSTAGGTRVVVTGEAIPAGARVRIGATTAATVTAVSATGLSFTTPARVAGSYDVWVFAPDGTSTVLTAGLTYVDAASAPTQPGTGPQPGTGTPPGATQPGATQPGAGTPPGTAQPPAADPVVTGPHGERLVRTARFAALGTAVWAVDCTRSCSGLAI
ncbi:S8 family serine peptidase [Geodermatophilus sp. SYSU D01180]